MFLIVNGRWAGWNDLISEKKEVKLQWGTQHPSVCISWNRILMSLNVCEFLIFLMLCHHSHSLPFLLLNSSSIYLLLSKGQFILKKGSRIWQIGTIPSQIQCKYCFPFRNVKSNVGFVLLEGTAYAFHPVCTSQGCTNWWILTVFDLATLQHIYAVKENTLQSFVVCWIAAFLLLVDCGKQPVLTYGLLAQTESDWFVAENSIAIQPSATKKC